MVELHFVLEVPAAGRVEVLLAAVLVDAPQPVVDEVVLPHILDFGLVQGVVLKVHDSVADQQALQVDVLRDVALVVGQDPRRHVGNVLASVTFPRKLSQP